MKNKSKPYGFYGGVTKDNHYIPPASTPFVPQPPSIPFLASYAASITDLVSTVATTQEFLSANNDILLRRHLVTQTDTEETYVINTIRHPNDLIVYSTGLSGAEDLSVLDGGTF
jgi:hypothetical protein